MCLYKKCEVCGDKINKLQSIWNLFSKKLEIKCKNCKSKYKISNKIIDWIYDILFCWDIFFIPYTSIILIVYFLQINRLEHINLLQLYIYGALLTLLTRKIIALFLFLIDKLKKI